jgi:Ni,Fe-hydrogenase III small subunit
MSRWLIRGIRRGIQTTTYPRDVERADGVTPGLPVGGVYGADAAAVAARCPTHALEAADGTVTVNDGRCIHCYRCRRDVVRPVAWRQDYEWAVAANEGTRGAFDAAFRRSIHILVVDAGDCGACLNEVKQLNNPYYNMHRLGLFITPSPRHADVLLVVGPVTDHMRAALGKIHEAMPTPKRVVAVGACALSGGIFADSFVCSRGVDTMLPVDVRVPGNPPPPLAILHGLLVAVGQKTPAVDGAATGAGTASK